MTADAQLPAPVDLPGSRLGLLSDSHADAMMTRAAIERLLAQQVDALIHLGDLCSTAVLDELATVANDDRLALPVFAVPGNMDDDPEDLARLGKHLGVTIDHPAGVYRAYDRAVIAHHGHIPRVERAAMEAAPDYLLHGHTHKVRDERIGPVRIINPGALHRAARYTVGVLDCADDSLEIIELPRP